MPPIRRGRRYPHGRHHIPGRRLPLPSGQSLYPGTTSHQPRPSITTHHRGFTSVHPSGLPPPVTPGWNGNPWASPELHTPPLPATHVEVGTGTWALARDHATGINQPSHRRVHSPRGPSCRTPALPSSVLEPLWVQIAALLPARQDTHPLGCHRPRIPDRIVFDKLIQILVFGCGYRRIADATCSATTLRRRRDEWITLDLAERLRCQVLAAYQHLFGLDLDHLVVDGCITKATAAAKSPGQARSTVASRA